MTATSEEKLEQVDQRGSGSPEANGQISLLKLVLAMVVSVLVAVASMAGVAFWLVKSGRLPLAGREAKIDAIATTDVHKTKLIALEPLVVNLADEGGRSYLRLAMTLRVEESASAKASAEKTEKGKPVNEDEAAMRDAVLDVVGQQTGQMLLTPGGKDHLKDGLKLALREHVPEVKVMDVLFTEFLVQR